MDNMNEKKLIREPARDISVFAECDILVVGGGPAGCAAAASAAKIGAEIIVLERYGHLGGMATGGLVLWLDRMSDWQGRQVITGFADEMLDRLPKDAVLGAPRDSWGSRDPDLVAYWKERASAFNGVVTLSPTYDLEMMKLAYFDALEAERIKLLLHSWVVAPIQEGNEIKGVVFESKAGRKAILARTVIDASGDGDVFAAAGEAFDTDIFQESWHHQLNVAWLWAGVDMERFLKFKHDNQRAFQSLAEQAKSEFNDVDARGYQTNVLGMPHVMPRNDVCLFMSPKLEGYSCLDIEDLTEVETVSRRIMMKMLHFYRGHVPGFEDAWVMLTAPQIGVRHSRRLNGVKQMSHEEWKEGIIHDDEIGVSPPPNTKNANVSIPLGCLIPRKLENLLVAGRNLSSDAITHSFMRLIPQCWQTGQAAGVAAAVAVNTHTRVRDADIAGIRKHLRRQGVYLSTRESMLKSHERAPDRKQTVRTG